MFDLIIKNAVILDGTGADGYTGDIAVKDGKIAEIGSGLTGAVREINAAGLTVSPGWIDSHSHSDRSILSNPDQTEKVEQGITFSIVGQCGSSQAPTGKISIEEFMRQAAATPQGSGAAMLVGHGNLRTMVMGTENRAPTAEELEGMKALLRTCMEAGAIGLSYGLVYMPGCYAAQDELVELAKVAAEYGGIIAAHLRNEADTLVEAVQEFMNVITASGCRGVFSHHKAANRMNWGKVNITLAMIDAANGAGADVYLDVYPYRASSTSLQTRFFPKQFHPEGKVDVRSLMKDPALRDEIRTWGRSIWGDDLSWTLVTECPDHKEYEGLNVNEIAALRGQEPYTAVFDLLAESGGRVQACFFMMCEEDIGTILQHDRAMICTDSGVAGKLEKYHPRLRASFPRALRKYVREDKVLSLPEMIRRMTSLPAYVYGLNGKGKIEVGADADLCVFDAQTIADRADFVNCQRRNEGLAYVIIDGSVVLEQGVYNGTRAAKVLTK